MSRSEGFTLAELAISVVIIALLLFGAMIPLSTQMEVRNVAETRRTMDQIREAIVGFAQSNGRLPCPANGTIAAGLANAGTEQLAGVAPNTTCSVTAGVIPWVTLGVPEVDSWGRRFSYRVVQTFADGIGVGSWDTPGQSPSCATPTPTNPTLSSFALCTLGNLTVNTRTEANHTATALAVKLPAVIISHGKNGYGAFRPTGTIVPGPSPDVAPADGVPDQNVDEAANVNLAATTFISRDLTRAASGCSDPTTGSSFCEFDDLVLTISAPTLIARMVNAGKLP